MHEYLICFAKNKYLFLKLENTVTRAKPNAIEIIKKAKSLFSKIGKKSIPEEIKEVVKPFNLTKEIISRLEVEYTIKLVNREFANWLSKQNFSGGEKAYNKIDEQGRVYQSVSMGWPNKEKAPANYFVPLVHPITNKNCPVPERGWRNPPETMQKLLEKSLIIFGEDESTQPRRKYLLADNLLENTPSIYNYGASDDTFFSEIGIEFPYAKPVEVAKYFIKSIHPKADIILDFFAGSGTTLHAVMQLNAEDGGSRQCILVTNNENRIAEEVCYERNRRVIVGYQNSKGAAVPGLWRNRLRYYRAGFVGREPTLENKRDLMRRATELLCIKEGCYTPLNLRGLENLGGLTVCQSADGTRRLLVVYEEDAIADAIRTLKAMEHPAGSERVKVYIFSPGQDPFTDEFDPVADRAELCALPDAIYQAYRNVLPHKDGKAWQNEAENPAGTEQERLFPSTQTGEVEL
jgi:hypothetical protein